MDKNPDALTYDYNKKAWVKPDFKSKGVPSGM